MADIMAIASVLKVPEWPWKTGDLSPKFVNPLDTRGNDGSIVSSVNDIKEFLTETITVSIVDFGPSRFSIEPIRIGEGE